MSFPSFFGFDSNYQNETLFRFVSLISAFIFIACFIFITSYFDCFDLILIGKFINLILVCGSVNKYVDSWTGNVKGQLEIPITEDISAYTITLQTDVELSNIQAKIHFVFLSEFLYCCPRYSKLMCPLQVAMSSPSLVQAGSIIKDLQLGQSSSWNT